MYSLMSQFYPSGQIVFTGYISISPGSQETGTSLQTTDQISSFSTPTLDITLILTSPLLIHEAVTSSLHLLVLIVPLQRGELTGNEQNTTSNNYQKVQSSVQFH